MRATAVVSSMLGAFFLLAPLAGAQEDAPLDTETPWGGQRPAPEPARAAPPPAPEPQVEDAPPARPGRNEPAVLEPFVGVATTPRRNVRLGFGFASIEAGGKEASSFAFTTAYTFAPEDGDFALDMELPIGSVDGFLLGDIGFDFRWRVLQARAATRAALGFGFILPSVLLNSLGGNRNEIYSRRIQSDVYDDMNLLPIRYWEMAPYFAVSHRVGPVLFTLDAGFFFLLASKERNRYESPTPELAVHYDLAVSGLLYREILAIVLELNGLSYVSEIAGDTKDGPTRPMGTGLTVTAGLRASPDPHVRISAGFQVPALGDDKLGRFDLTSLYLHEVSAVAEVAFLVIPRGASPPRPPRVHGHPSSSLRSWSLAPAE